MAAPRQWPRTRDAGRELRISAGPLVHVSGSTRPCRAAGPRGWPRGPGLRSHAAGQDVARVAEGPLRGSRVENGPAVQEDGQRTQGTRNLPAPRHRPPAVDVDPLRHRPGIRAVHHPRHRPLAQRRDQEHDVRGRAHGRLPTQANAHLAQPCPLALQVQETVTGVHRQVQLGVAQRLPTLQLGGDGQAVLLRGRDGIDSPALGLRHGGAHARQVPAVLHALVGEDEVRQEEERRSPEPCPRRCAGMPRAGRARSSWSALPPSAPIEATATEQENQHDDHQEQVGIHGLFPFKRAGRRRTAGALTEVASNACATQAAFPH